MSSPLSSPAAPAASLPPSYSSSVHSPPTPSAPATTPTPSTPATPPAPATPVTPSAPVTPTPSAPAIPPATPPSPSATPPTPSAPATPPSPSAAATPPATPPSPSAAATPPSPSATPPTPSAAATPPATPPTPSAGATPPSPSATPPTPSAAGTPPATPPSPSATPPTPSAAAPPPATPSTPSAPATPSNGSSSLPSPASSSSSVSVPVVVGATVGAVVVLAFVTILFFYFKKKRRQRSVPNGHHGSDDARRLEAQNRVSPSADHTAKITGPHISPPLPAISSSGGSASNHSRSGSTLPSPSFGYSRSTFTYEELSSATDGFSDANLLGEGGFGYVHRGLLQDGREVAVKQLKAGSGQGEREFQAEVEIISRVHHRHLVSLVGYCIADQGRRLLVYEYVPNNTLQFHLHGEGRPTMDWSTRLKIALGSAKGLAYLHEDCHPKIIHRDIKAANILLDFNFEAKVADFGLAKLSSDTNTHVSTRVMGTFGYLAPEYASSGKLTEKSDVFSFGVMLLELITGHRPLDLTNMDESLVEWARPLLSRALEDGNCDALVDPKLQNSYDNREMARTVACAAACICHSARGRPRMSQVVRALEGDVSLKFLNHGVKPGQSTVYDSRASTDNDSGQYKVDMKKLMRLALRRGEYASSDYSPQRSKDMNKSVLSVPTSQEYSSSEEYSVTTGEYGQNNPSGSSTEAYQSHGTLMRRIKGYNSGFSGPS